MLRELADLLRSKLAAEAKKAEYAAVLVQHVVMVPDAPTPSSSLLLAALAVPLLRKKTKKKVAAVPLPPSTHHQPMACLLCCGVRRKCKILRHTLWPITSCAYGVKKCAATTPCWFLINLATSSTSSSVRSYLPSPSNTAPSHPLIFNRCWDATVLELTV
jgi:hypothetical protein